MPVQHLATRLRVTPKIIESIIHALPRNDLTGKELDTLVQEIQNVQHRYLQGDNLDTATTNTSELGASNEPKTTDQIEPVESKEHHWKKGEWSQKYKGILDKTKVPAQNLQNYLGDCLEQVDTLVLNTLPDIIGKRLLKKYYEDIRWMSAKYYGDPTDDNEFKRLVNKKESKRESQKAKKERKREGRCDPNMENKTVGDEGVKALNEVVSRAEIEKGTISYLRDPVVRRQTTESPSQRKSEANRQNLSVGQTMQSKLGPAASVSDKPMEESSDRTLAQDISHCSDIQIAIKVEESPTPELLMRRMPQYLEFNHNNMTSMGDCGPGVFRLVDAICEERGNRAELDAENGEAEILKIARERINKVSGQTKLGHKSAGSDKIQELGQVADTIKRRPQLNLEKKVEEQSTGQKQGGGLFPHKEPRPYIPTPGLRNSLELSKFGDSYSPQETKYLEPLLNERLPAKPQNHPEGGEAFIESPLWSTSGTDDADASRKSLAISIDAVRNRRLNRRERKQLWRKARESHNVGRPIESLPIKERNSAEIRIMCSDGELRPRGDEDEEMLVFVDWEQAAQNKLGNNDSFNPVQLYRKFLRSMIDDKKLGSRPMRTDQAAMLVYVIIGTGSPCAITQFVKLSMAMREELQVNMEFLPGHENYGRAALRLTQGPDEGPFKPFAESVVAHEFFRLLESERATHGEMLPLTARAFDFLKIGELEKRLPPRHGRGANLRALQQTGYRLSKLTSIYGEGILALIPSSGHYGDCLNVLANMDEASFTVFLQHMDKDRDQFLLKLCPLLEPYVREGMWGTLTLPKLRVEVDGEFDEMAVKDRSDQLASMCLPSWACIRLDRK
ncbi:hypothetical protein V493_04901 [Pseudogymnoascus sp. VKM F-4281 (FW-2241)]|nr:hypothetical protein V493_04901 [Pseudogymnoascus sp. VKM F-4281 (FW-2241)]